MPSLPLANPDPASILSRSVYTSCDPITSPGPPSLHGYRTYLVRVSLVDWGLIHLSHLACSHLTPRVPCWAVQCAGVRVLLPVPLQRAARLHRAPTAHTRPRQRTGKPWPAFQHMSRYTFGVKACCKSWPLHEPRDPTRPSRLCGVIRSNIPWRRPVCCTWWWG